MNRHDYEVIKNLREKKQYRIYLFYLIVLTAASVIFSIICVKKNSGSAVSLLYPFLYFTFSFFIQVFGFAGLSFPLNTKNLAAFRKAYNGCSAPNETLTVIPIKQSSVKDYYFTIWISNVIAISIGIITEYFSLVYYKTEMSDYLLSRGKINFLFLLYFTFSYLNIFRTAFKSIKMQKLTDLVYGIYIFLLFTLFMLSVFFYTIFSTLNENLFNSINNFIKSVDLSFMTGLSGAIIAILYPVLMFVIFKCRIEKKLGSGWYN